MADFSNAVGDHGTGTTSRNDINGQNKPLQQSPGRPKFVTNNNKDIYM